MENMLRRINGFDLGWAKIEMSDGRLFLSQKEFIDINDMTEQDIDQFTGNLKQALIELINEKEGS